jgi:hypothetical protein
LSFFEQTLTQPDPTVVSIGDKLQLCFIIYFTDFKQVGGEGRDTGVGSSGLPSPSRDNQQATDGYSDDMESYSEGTGHIALLCN